jgi:hypothetical protein
MRVNIYDEEITDRMELVEKNVEGVNYFGLRFYLELPATVNGILRRGPFIKMLGEDDTAAVTFWSTDKARLVLLLKNGLAALGEDPAPQV